LIGPACRSHRQAHQPFSLIFLIRQLDVACSDPPRQRRETRFCAMRLPGFNSRRRSAERDRRAPGDPALGFGSSCRVSDTSLQMRIRRGCSTATDRQVLRTALATVSARGFPAPFLRECFSPLSRLIHLHGAVCTSPGVAVPSASCEPGASPIYRTRAPEDRLPV
jgi:hypothetical protein